MAVRTDPEALPPPRHAGEHLQVGDEYYVLASSLASRRRKHVLGHGDTFAVLDQSGDIPLAVEEELGLFFRGTRHLSQLELLAYDRPPFFLSATVTRDNLRAVANLTNNDVGDHGVGTPRSTLSIRRTTLVAGSSMLVRLVVHSFHLEPLSVRLALRFWADFLDVFELRGMHRPRAGVHDPPRAEGNALVFGYAGLDGVRRATRCQIDGAEPAWHGAQAFLDVVLAPEEERMIDVSIECCNAEVEPTGQHGFARAEAARLAEHRRWRAEAAVLQAPDDELNGVIEQALADVFMLTAPPEPGTSHAVDRYLYAGIPWFATIFGRDGLIAARELLFVAPGLARGVLRVLAALQGTRLDPDRDEQPGKILHEARYGEMAAVGEVPFGRYYGTVDATPLFCMLLGDYARATGDLAFVRELWPHALGALAWMEDWGDLDRDGYLEYARTSEHGLTNQGWKDSGDAIFHRDGTLAEAPIALVEVQGYRYAALRAMADLADAIGVAGALRWREEAVQLRERINHDFWLEREDTYALALDRDKRPCAVVA